MSAKWFNPIDQLEDVARRFISPKHGDFAVTKGELKPTEVLIVMGDRGLFKQAFWAENQELFDDYYRQYSSGILLEFKTFALPLELLDEFVK